MKIKEIDTVELAKIYRKLDYPVGATSRDRMRDCLLGRIMRELEERADIASNGAKMAYKGSAGHSLIGSQQ